MRNINRFVTTSELLDDKTRRILESGEVLVTGQPLRHINREQELFFDDCRFVLELPLFIHSAIINRISRAGHLHVPDRYIGEYPVLIGYEIEQPTNEYLMGVSNQLGFEIQPYSY